MGWPPRVTFPNTTISVGTGKDFTTLKAAIADLETRVIDRNVTINVTETQTLGGTESIDIIGDLSRVVVQGPSPVSRSLVSVQSSSGVAGARSIILNMSSVAGIIVDAIITFDNPIGGVNPTYLLGAFRITAVDAVNTRITIYSTNWAPTAPSGAVSGAGLVYSVVINSNSSGANLVSVTGAIGAWQDLPFLGLGAEHVFTVGSGGRFSDFPGTTNFIFVNIDEALIIGSNGQCNALSVNCGNSASGITLNTGGILNVGTLTANGNNNVAGVNSSILNVYTTALISGIGVDGFTLLFGSRLVLAGATIDRVIGTVFKEELNSSIILNGPVITNYGTLLISDKSPTDDTATRALNTSYTNARSSTSKEVSITVRCASTLAAGTAYVQGFADFLATPTTTRSGITGIQVSLLNEDNSYNLTFVVPGGMNYRVNSTVAGGGSVVLGKWFESFLT